MRVFCLLIRRRSPGSLMVLVLATALLGCIPQAASAEESSASSEAEFYSVCPAQPGHYECMVQAQPLALTLSGITPQVSPNLEGGGEKGGLDPQNLREAYKLPETGGSGQTVAIVDAFNDPKAEANLNVYREKYGLGSCTRSNGCFKKVNQKGESSENEEASIYPANEYEWSVEISLDLDMVSAICKECHIVLVEAINNKKNSEGVYNLDIAENEAAALKGTTEISNSWGGSERSEETSEDTYFNHPGIPITFSAGDSGYGVEYPAASHHVIAVGGTTLKKAENSRGWSETVWSGTGSGCSAYDEKPLWQTGSPWQAVCTGTTSAVIKGWPDPRKVSTSYVERQNLTVRMGMRRFTRLTNGFSKKVKNLAHAVSLHYMYYNFGRPHQTLANPCARTPAMAAGVADHVWSLREIAELD